MRQGCWYQSMMHSHMYCYIPLIHATHRDALQLTVSAPASVSEDVSAMCLNLCTKHLPQLPWSIHSCIGSIEIHHTTQAAMVSDSASLDSSCRPGKDTLLRTAVVPCASSARCYHPRQKQHTSAQVTSNSGISSHPPPHTRHLTARHVV